MGKNYGIGADTASTSSVVREKSILSERRSGGTIGRVPGWDRSTAAGWVLCGMFGGLIGLLACFLVNRNTARFSRTMAAAGVGMLVGIMLVSLLVMVFGYALTDMLGGGGGYRVDYIGV